MTDQEINIAIAEACGFVVHFEGTVPYASRDKHPNWDRRVFKSSPLLPCYTTDLNAMHEAEKVLNVKQAVWYLQKLSQVRLNGGEGGMIACMIDRLAFATARQRAEAFLRTIGKWRDV